MDRLVDRLTAAADALTTVDRAVPALSAPAGAFGTDHAGLPGRLGHELHAHWSAVLQARAREAADTAAHLAELAQGVRATAQDYSDTDDEVARRLERSV
jgi:hypothetical protein